MKEHTRQEFHAGIENLKSAEKQQHWKVVISIVKITLLLLIIIGIPLYLYFFQFDWLKGFKDIETIVAFLNRY